MTHNIKIRESFAEAVMSGEKTFEIRKNDRGYQKGDLIQFSVVDDVDIYVDSELTKHKYRITYVLSGWGLEKDYVALGIRREEEGAEQWPTL